MKNAGPTRFCLPLGRRGSGIVASGRSLYTIVEDQQAIFLLRPAGTRWSASRDGSGGCWRNERGSQGMGAQMRNAKS